VSQMPVIFLSHGSPMLPFEPVPARDFLRGLAARLPRPQAILVMSAHWEETRPHVGTAAHPETIHDFYGFPQQLYDLTYPAPGAPEQGRRAVELLGAAGWDPGVDSGRGLDHGAWVPLLLAYPAAAIPVFQVSLLRDGDSRAHLALGAALAPLREEGVLIIGSGGAVHNLRDRGRTGEPPAPWAAGYEAWLRSHVEAGDRDGLLAHAGRPDDRLAHPGPDHLMPLFAALGAAEGEERGVTLHSSFTHRNLAMTAFRWG